MFQIYDYIDAGILLVISIPGLVLNLAAGIIISRHRTFNNAFGRLTAVHAIANAGILLIFVAYVVPVTIFESTFLSYFWLNRLMGQIALSCEEAVFHSCLFLSINRLAAIAKPSLYRQYFNGKLTAIIIGIIILLCIGYQCFYVVESCSFIYDGTTHTFNFSSSPCGQIMAHIDLHYNCSMFAVAILCDLGTLILLQKNKQLLKAKSPQNQSATKLRKEVLFFVQALTCTLVYTIMLVGFHILGHVFGYPFVFLTVFWACGHALNGAILVAFYDDVRRSLKLSFGKSKSSQATATTVTPALRSTSN